MRKKQIRSLFGNRKDAATASLTIICFWFTCFYLFTYFPYFASSAFCFASFSPQKLSMVLRQAMINLNARLNRFMQGYNAENRTKNSNVWCSREKAFTHSKITTLRFTSGSSTIIPQNWTFNKLFGWCVIDKEWRALLFDGFFKFFEPFNVKKHIQKKGIKIQLLLFANAEIYGHMIFIRLVRCDTPKNYISVRETI